ncbi:PREDICTED: mucin-19-like [Chrysochloris asiatica]|uniref:Mucin-19-like n=1 Tax=Chrysochloris asiatica TaxID=185453 RepID=A0A9B0TMT6_CHRAS|nr:PREDICTED: mucin-19-like [Chrysochloris asiatica]
MIHCVSGTTVIVPGTTGAPGSSSTGTTKSISEKTLEPGNAKTGTSGTPGGRVPGDETGTTGGFSRTTITSGNANTDLTILLLLPPEVTESTQGTGFTGTGAIPGEKEEPMFGVIRTKCFHVPPFRASAFSFMNTGRAETTAPGSYISSSQTGTNDVISGTTIAPGRSSTKTTISTGGSKTTQVEWKTGITTILGEEASLPEGSFPGTRIVPGITSSPGNSNAGSTTGTFEKQSPRSETVTTGVTPHTAIEPGRSSSTKSTTSSEIKANTGAETATGTTPPATTPPASVGVTSNQEGTPVVSSGMSENSNAGTTKGVSERTTTSVISTTGTTVVTDNQETENTTECPVPLPPTPVCHGPLGEEKSPGDIWIANCHRCTCTDAKTLDCKPKECPSPPICKNGERLRKFRTNDTCCEIGYCEPRTCLFNNTDYEVGASFDDPSNPCISYSCKDTGITAAVQNCPKQTWCEEENRIYDSKKCCYTCKKNCTTSLVNVTVKLNGCQKRIKMAVCSGDCKNTIKYNYNIFQLEKSCHCCQEEAYEQREIDLDCQDGSTLPYTYRHITACSCLDKCQQSMMS